MSTTQACASCGFQVMPTTEGYCPSCVQPFQPAAEGQTAFEGRRIDEKRDTSHHGLIKLALVLFVAPVVAQMTSMGFALLVSLPLAAFSTETQLGLFPILGHITNLLGLACGIFAAWKYWPKP